MPIYNLTLKEVTWGEFEIEAKNKAEAKRKFWDELPNYDVGEIMDDAGGIEIIEVTERR